MYALTQNNEFNNVLGIFKTDKMETLIIKAV